MDVRDTDQAAVCPLSVAQVADLLETVYAANGRMASEVDLIVGSRAAVSQATVDRFARLADELRAGAAARAELAELDADLLMAGTSLWMRRRRTAEQSASARAAARWNGGRPA